MILIIEDCLDSQTLYQFALSTEKFDVKTVSNGLEALEFLEKHQPPALILMDYHMPQMNGKELAEKIKSNPNWAHIKILVISGITDLKDRARQMKADGFLAKPFELSNLYSEVKKLTELK